MVRTFQKFMLLLAVNFLLMIIIFTSLSTPINAQEGAQASRQLTGVISVLYGDHPETPQILYQLHAPDGTSYLLYIPPEVLGAAGGIVAIQRQTATITFADVLPATTAASEAVLVVNALTLLPTPTLDALEPAATGAQTWVNLLCRFKNDAAEPFTPAGITALFGNTAPFINRYWQEASMNQYSVPSVTTTNWASLPKTRAEYIALGSPNVYLTALFADCTALHTASVTYNNFYGINMFFNNQLDNSYWGGSCQFVTLQGIQKCWRATWLPYYNSTDLHAYAHEMGHAQGLPHSNNSDGDSNPYDSLVDVMSGRPCLIYVAAYGCQQPHLNAVHKAFQNWIAAERDLDITTTSTNTIILDRSSLPNSPNYYTASIRTTNPNVYYVVEARRNDFTNFDSTLYSSGVVIYEVNLTRSEPVWQSNAVSDGTSGDGPGVFLVGETYRNFAQNFAVQVNSQTTNGYNVTITKGLLADSPDLVTTLQNTTSGNGKILYTVRVQNTGTVPVTNALLAIDNPSNLHLNKFTGTSACTRVSYINSTTCAIGNLGAGQQMEFMLDFRPTNSASATLRPVAVSNEIETNSTNNRLSLTTPIVTPLPDLFLNLTANKSPSAALNEQITYTLRAQNAGGVSGSSVTLTFALPAGLSYGGFGWNYYGFFSGVSCSYSAPNVTCSIASFGSSYSFGDYFDLNVYATGTSNGIKIVAANATLSGTDATPADNATSLPIYIGVTGTVTGHVDLSRAVAAPNAVYAETVTVTISDGASGIQLISGDITTDTSGNFTQVGVPPGNYKIRVKSSSTLSVVWTGTITAGTNTIDFGLLREGDADNNNLVNITDFSLLATSFGKISTDVGFDGRTDFNADGLVNITDFSLLATHFGQTGQN